MPFYLRPALSLLRGKARTSPQFHPGCTCRPSACEGRYPYGLPYALLPVSYTHLDVYKRQKEEPALYSLLPGGSAADYVRTGNFDVSNVGR